MSPRPADPAVRTALLEAAAHVIATEGLGKLTLRRLAAEVGTSTMAVYTHFGSMLELRREVRREGFARLGAALGAVAETDDPVADYVVLGWAYYGSGTAQPDLYRAMFMDGPVDDEDAAAGLETFEPCIAAARRCIEAGRFEAMDPLVAATQAWAILHGLVSLQIAHLLPADQASTALAASRSLFRALGDDPEALEDSYRRALARIQADDA